VRASLSNDHSCQSRVQTRAFDAGPFPLVGLADIRMSGLWVGGHVNPTLLVKWHEEGDHMVLSQATGPKTKGVCTHSVKHVWSTCVS
jgi:hypothetical protein